MAVFSFQESTVAALKGTQEIATASKREALQDRCQQPFQLGVCIGELRWGGGVASLHRREQLLQFRVHGKAAWMMRSASPGAISRCQRASLSSKCRRRAATRAAKASSGNSGCLVA